MADSSSVSVSGSSSFIPNYPQSGFLTQVAQYQLQLEQQQMGWAQQQYEQNTQLTNQVINNYLQASSQAYGQATSDLNQYNQLFAPENAQLVQDANTYASTSRQSQMMGAAESTNAQAFDSQRQAALQQLTDFGIDPSSGRYASLDAAERAQQAAAGAGAANQAQLATTATGQQLRQQAIQVGETLPAQAINELNASMQGQAGAENAALANAASGLAMLTAPAQYGALATQLKYPPLGNASGSSSSQQSGGGNQSSGNSGNGAGNQTPQFSGGPGGTPYQTQAGPNAGQMLSAPGSAGSSGGRGQPNASVTQMNGQGGNVANEGDVGNPLSEFPYNPYTQDASMAGNPYGVQDPTADPSQFPGEYGNPAPINPAETDQNGTQPFTDPNVSPWGNSPANNSSFDWSQGDQAQLDQNLQSFDNQLQNLDQTAQDFSANDWGNWASSGDTSGGSADNSGGDTSGWTSSDNSGGGDNSGSFDMSGDFGGDSSAAMGGTIPGYAAGGMPTSGGPVTRAMSPSGGRQTDDVNAHLNADEFVIPRDVHKWKGEEFFHDLINKSRKARANMISQSGAVPKMKPHQGGPATFRSHPTQALPVQ